METHHIDEDTAQEVEIEMENRDVIDSSSPNNSVQGKPALVFQDLGYKVSSSKWKRNGRCLPSRVTKEKIVIEGVTGCLHYGEVVALMGGSGAGKSSLLDLLACRKDPKNMLGDIRYDGRHRRRLHSNDAGYVVQSDMALANLTVFETLMFAAKFRLRCDKEQKTNIINQLLQELRLTHTADTRVGSSLNRGISGGEFRRLAIAESLITSPKMLFLDEPTSGLDSSSAMVVVSLLRQLAQTRNQLIVVSIHQPSQALMELFDTVIVLSKSSVDRVGRVAYMGPVASLPQYPPSVGYPVPAYFGANALEFLMEVSTRNNVSETSDAAMLNSGDKQWVCPNVDLTTIWPESGAGQRNREQVAELIQSFEQMPRRNTKREKDLEANRTSEEPVVPEEPEAQYPTSRWNQITTFSHRVWLNMIRDPGFLFARFGIAHVIGLFLSSLYARLSTDDQGLQNTVSCIFFMLLIAIVMAEVFLPMWIVERPLVSRERQSRLYSSSAVVLGSVIPNLPVEIFNYVTFATYVYWIIGLRINAYYWFCWVVNYVGNGFLLTFLMMLTSAISPTQEVALALSPIIFLFWLMFSGFFVLIKTIPVWYRWWAPYLSPLRYSLAVAMFTQFHGVTFDCSDDADCQFADGADILEYYGVDITSDLGMWGYIGIVYLWALVFLVCLYLANRFIKWQRG